MLREQSYLTVAVKEQSHLTVSVLKAKYESSYHSSVKGAVTSYHSSIREQSHLAIATSITHIVL